MKADPRRLSDISYIWIVDHVYVNIQDEQCLQPPDKPEPFWYERKLDLLFLSNFQSNVLFVRNVS